MGFQYFRNNRGDLCPICQGERGKPDCRKSDQSLYFCRGPHNNDGYRFIGWDTNGFGMYVTADAYAHRAEHSAEHKQEQRLRQARLAVERKARLAQLPSIDERDHQFRRIAINAGLGSRHRKHLKEQRGLSDAQIDTAIEQGLFWTWPDNANIPLLPLNLPGVDPSTGRLRYLQRGLAIAVPDATGKITGVQIRPDFGGKYFWVSSDSDKLPIPGSGPQLPNGELPIAVHAVEGSKTVGLCDSVSLKPYLASQRLQATVIGAAGSNFASCPEALRAALDELQPEQIILYPDAGDSSNPSVNKAIEKTVDLLQGWNLPLKIAWWGQHSHDDDCDIDELPLDQLDRIELLSPETYLGMTKTILEDQWKHQYEQQALKTWKKSRQFTPTQTVHQQYLNIQPEDLSNAGVFAIKSAMGTGKTQWLQQYFETTDIGAVAIGYRNSLLLQSCERWPNFYHLHSDAAFDMVRDPHSRIACCLDSLGRFEDRDFEGKILILDESLSIILHGLMSGTLIGKRDQCLAKLQAAIQRAKVVLPMDGNNTDVVVDYIAKLRDGGTVHKILNTYQRKQLQIELLGKTITAKGKSIDERSPLMQLALTTLAALDVAPEQIARSIVLFSDSQRQCQIAEDMFESRGYSTLRVDSKTATSAEVKAFLKDPDRYL
ncbi:MAG: plasmid replication protein, CyRepA1 family, partial [Thermosynechococcaceae cyanobacterium]